MITKEIVTGMISILPDGLIQVRTDTVISEDGVELSRTYHREILEPGQDVSDRDVKLQLICAVVWTLEVVAEFDMKRLVRHQAMREEIGS